MSHNNEIAFRSLITKVSAFDLEAALWIANNHHSLVPPFYIPPEKSMYDSLECSFDWAKTPQGWGFWNALHLRMAEYSYIDGYLVTVSRVRRVDPEAAEYLLNLVASPTASFMQLGCLGVCFSWCESPQGYNYWRRVYEESRRLPAYPGPKLNFPVSKHAA